MGRRVYVHYVAAEVVGVSGVALPYLNTVETVDVIAYIISLVFLSYAAFSDLKRREVDNWVWLIYAPLGMSATIIRIICEPTLWMVSLFSIVVTSCIALLMFYLGLFGGADAKAFLCLAVTTPIFPLWIKPVLGWFHPIFPLAVLFNTYLLTVSILVYASLKNVSYLIRRKETLFKDFEKLSFTRRILAFFTGYKVTFDTLRREYLYAMEEVDGGERKLRMFFNAEIDREVSINELEKKYKADKIHEVWATPGLPLLTFAFASFLITAIVGDVLTEMIILLIDGLTSI